jgi:predicted peptidase
MRRFRVTQVVHCAQCISDHVLTIQMAVRAICFTVVLLCFFSSCATERVRQHGEFVERSVTWAGSAHRYQVFLPATSFSDRKPPVIIFLHGADEGGNDNRRQTEVGIGPHIRKNMDMFPAIVMFPQTVMGGSWSQYAPLVLKQLDAVLHEFDADVDRVYLTGLSTGGTGVLDLALREPERFAALVPISGPLNTSTALLNEPMAFGRRDPYKISARVLKGIPIWMFHGSKDYLVSPISSRRLYSALQEASARDARYTEFPNANHNAWDDAYRNTPGLWKWLFAQRRGR